MTNKRLKNRELQGQGMFTSDRMGSGVLWDIGNTAACLRKRITPGRRNKECKH